MGSVLPKIASWRVLANRAPSTCALSIILLLEKRIRMLPDTVSTSISEPELNAVLRFALKLC